MDLARRAELAQRHLSDCRLCPFLCGEARASGRGVCRVGGASYIASEMLHMGEEEVLHPAHAIFFSGCTAKCSFCTAARYAFHPTYGVTVTAAQLAQRIVQRLLALTLGMFINGLLGRPPRALAAYDGR